MSEEGIISSFILYNLVESAKCKMLAAVCYQVQKNNLSIRQNHTIGFLKPLNQAVLPIGTFPDRKRPVKKTTG